MKINITTTLDVALRDAAKENGICISDVLDRAVREELMLTPDNPEKNVPKKELENTFEALRKSPHFAVGQSNRIRRMFGVRISPKRLLELADQEPSASPAQKG